jgi:PKD repeat protein
MKKFLYISIAIIFVFALKTKAQSTKPDTADYPYWIDMMQNDTVNFYDVQKAFNQFYDKHHDAKEENAEESEGEEEHYGFELYRRWEYMMLRRINPDGSRRPADQTYKEFMKYSANKLSTTPGIRGLTTTPGTNPTGNWTTLGPTPTPINNLVQINGVGRINAIAFHPTNKATIYVGAPAGGLWVTTDSGTTWTVKTDALATLGVSAIAIDPGTPSTIYIGTGDREHYDAPGLGVMKSTNSGSTWSASNSGMGSLTVSKLLINPSNTSILIAATSAGIYRSTNSGANWSKTSSNSNFYKDLVFKPHNPNVVYAEENGNFYRSTNNGVSWTKITSGLSSAYRGVIGVTPADTNRVYFVTTNQFTFSACYVSTDGGSNFRSKSTTPNIMDYSDNGSGTGGQAWYDLCVSVDTSKKGTLYVGGINVFKSADSGTNWTCIAHWYGSSLPVIHSDLHVFAINPLNNRLYLGHDGGICYTANGGTSWKDISSGLAIGQIYKIGQSASRSDMMIAGFQDNGTAVLSNGKWYSGIGGDGMECAIDPADTNYQYGELYYGDMYRSTDAGQSFTTHIAGNGVGSISEAGDWVTPYMISRSNYSTMFAGYHNIWRCTAIKNSSPSWTKISNNLASSNSYFAEAMDQSAVDSNIFYFSRSDNRLFLSTNINSSTPTWTDLTSSLPNSTSLVVEVRTHPKYPNVVYIIQNYNVYVSTNKGSSWTKITGTLPAIAKNILVLDKNSYSGIYVGTDAGVYYRDSTMSDWTSFYSGLPAAARIMDLQIYYDPAKSSNNKLKAGSFGRGSWQSDLYSPVTPVASFVINNSAQCLTGNSFSFTDSSKISVGSIAAWAWDFGDGKTSTSQNPSHTYTSSGTFTVKLIVTSSLGTTDNISKTVTVYIQATPSFTINNSGQCLTGNSFSFTDKSTITSGTITSWAWNFGDLNTSASQSPTHSYTSGGVFKVSLKTTTNNGCTDTVSKYVNVYSMPTASYSVNSSTQCKNGNSFVFTDNSTVSGSTLGTWAWDFGDLGTSATENPTHVYSSTGTFTIKLKVTSAVGCAANTSGSVTVNPSPTAAYSINSSSQCLSGNSFSFTDKSTISSGTISTYSWDFGDLNTSASQNPSHSYSAAGTYRVKLKVTSSSGCVDTTSKTVNVYPQPSSLFTVNNATQCKNGNSFVFTNKTTISSGSITTSAWDFGDGSTGSNFNASHTYTGGGTFTVKLKVTSNNGCTDSTTQKMTVYPSPAGSFSVNNTAQCFAGNSFVLTDKSTLASGTISTWAWDFGDGNTSSTQSPSHSYGTSGTYTIKLKITANSGCTDTISKVITVYPQPKAGFTINNASQCYNGNSYKFTDNSSISSGSLSSWAWDFGDAGTSAAQNPSHTYAAPGTYTIKLKITSSNGCLDSLSKTVTVYPQPKASATVNTVSQCFGSENFIFTDKSTVPAGFIASWNWNFGDGTSIGTQNPSHKYLTTGTYTVKLTVTTNGGCTDTSSLTTKVNPQPAAAFSINNSNQCFSTNSFNFTDKSTIAGGSISTWAWNFGDGNVSSLQSPTNSYKSPGTYTVSLKITSDLGCTDSFAKTVNIFAMPTAAFSVDQTAECLPGNSFNFTDNSNVGSGKISSWIWNFGDGINGSAQNPIHSYLKAGIYLVKLKAFTNNGCVDSTSKTIRVYGLPVPVIIGDSAVCSGHNATYYTKPDSGSSYTWRVSGGSILSGAGTNSIVINWPKFAGGSVHVTETNLIGCTDSTKASVFVMPSPFAKFGSAGSVCPGSTLQFRDSSSGGTKFLYSFGDGDTSSKQKPSHIYKASGKYIVQQKIVNSTGCADSTTRVVTVLTGPNAHWTLSYSGKNTLLHALDSSMNDTAYHWTLGDGNNATGHLVSHMYPKNKAYAIALKIPYVGCGNEYDSTVNITVSSIDHYQDERINLTVYPNPFTNQTTLEYNLITESKVRIGIFDYSGKEIGMVAEGNESPGKYSYSIDGAKYNLKPGIYLLKLMLDDHYITMHLVKVGN